MAGPPTAALAPPDAQTHDRPRFQATYPHPPESRDTNASWRVPDASEGVIEAIKRARRELRLDCETQPDGGVTRRDVIRHLTRNPPPPPRSPIPDNTLAEAKRVRRSPADGLEGVAAGGRLPGNEAETLRPATRNVSGLPKGFSPSPSCEANAAEFNRLAGTLNGLEADVVAVQALLDTPPAQAPLALTLAQLASLSGGNGQVDLQVCGAAQSQRVGLLRNAARATLEAFTDLAALYSAADPDGAACVGHLRPGRHCPDDQRQRPRRASDHRASGQRDGEPQLPGAK